MDPAIVKRELPTLDKGWGPSTCRFSNALIVKMKGSNLQTNSTSLDSPLTIWFVEVNGQYINTSRLYGIFWNSFTSIFLFQKHKKEDSQRFWYSLILYRRSKGFLCKLRNKLIHLHFFYFSFSFKMLRNPLIFTQTEFTFQIPGYVVFYIKLYNIYTALLHVYFIPAGLAKIGDPICNFFTRKFWKNLIWRKRK